MACEGVNSCAGDGGVARMLVRDARDDDMGAVQAIYAHHVLHGTASFEEEPPPLAEMQRRRADVLARGLPYLVEDVDGRIAGYSDATPPLRVRALASGRAEWAVGARRRAADDRHHRGQRAGGVDRPACEPRIP